jgi:hypothetical protein
VFNLEDVATEAAQDGSDNSVSLMVSEIATSSLFEHELRATVTRKSFPEVLSAPYVRVIDRPPSTSIAVPDWKLEASEAR